MFLYFRTSAIITSTSFRGNTADQWYFTDDTCSVNITTCPPGAYFFPKQSTTNDFDAGGCPFSCPNGTYAGGTAYRTGRGDCDHPCDDCPVGTFCNRRGGTGTPSPCPAGTYGSSHGLFDSTCSGFCAPGHYCPAGSTNRTAARCPTGRYRSRVGAASAGDCDPCGHGHKCDAS